MIELFLGIIVIALLIAVFLLLKKIQSMEERFQQLVFSKQSQSVKYGKTSEQFLPFAKEFPFSTGNFRFIGSPIDGIAFDDEKIVFCEFKAGNAKLSEKQKRIKELVESGKVEWFELNMK